VAGSPGFTLTVNGSNFVPSSVVRWNGADRTTTYQGATQLQAAIQGSDIATPGSVPVTVFTPGPGGGNSNALTFTVNPSSTPTEVTLDNAPAGMQDAARSFTGAWCTSSAADHFGADSLYSCGGGVDSYRWTATIAAGGTYDVYVWWSTHPNRSTAVPITVGHAGGATTLTFNEQVNGGQWVLHGRYSFNAGPGGYVEGSSANGQAAADAVRWVPVQ
jgi:hypothetical protein